MKQKRKRSRVLALLALLCLGVGCGVPPAQESGEESRIAPAEDSRPAAVEEWKGPEIIHCRIPENSDKRLEIEVALYTLGLRYIQTRSGAEALEKYAYRILKIGSISSRMRFGPRMEATAPRILCSKGRYRGNRTTGLLHIWPMRSLKAGCLTAR